MYGDNQTLVIRYLHRLVTQCKIEEEWKYQFGQEKACCTILGVWKTGWMVIVISMLKLL